MSKIKPGDLVKTGCLLFMEEQHWDAFGIVLKRVEYNIEKSVQAGRRTNVMLDVYMGDGKVIKLFENEVEIVSDD